MRQFAGDGQRRRMEQTGDVRLNSLDRRVPHLVETPGVQDLHAGVITLLVRDCAPLRDKVWKSPYVSVIARVGMEIASAAQPQPNSGAGDRRGI